MYYCVSIGATTNIRGWNMNGPKPSKKLCYEGFQYGAGDIAVVSERDSLHLYEVVDSWSRSENLARKNIHFSKENIFANVHGKKN